MACESTEIDRKTATILTEKMLIGLGDLLSKGIYTLPTLQEKVCVKGGITGEGIKVLEASKIDETFADVFRATHEKFAEDIEEIEKQFRSPFYYSQLIRKILLFYKNFLKKKRANLASNVCTGLSKCIDHIVNSMKCNYLFSSNK